MFKKILLPLDLTDKHGPALAIAAELVQQSSGEVTLLHVIELIPGLSLEEEHAFYNRLERMALAHLKRQGSTRADRQLAWRKEVLIGRRAEEIVRFASKASAELIVLTAPRIEPEDPTGLGSMSYKVGILAHCPVLLVK
jgi:nucleotide-binding universal stress UspA family protein